MTEQCKADLNAAGIQADEALERFMGNEALLARFLKKFPEDQSYDALCRALKAGDTEGAFRASHTLKGVCGNLSMRTLFTLVSGQTECLRSGDLAGGAAQMPEITRTYEAVCDAIRRCFPD